VQYLLATKNKASSLDLTHMQLRRLEEEIPVLKGKRREEAIEIYRELLRILKDEPIYLMRYE
jgi:hypothetical protein